MDGKRSGGINSRKAFLGPPSWALPSADSLENGPLSMSLEAPILETADASWQCRPRAARGGPKRGHRGLTLLPGARDGVVGLARGPVVHRD